MTAWNFLSNCWLHLQLLTKLVPSNWHFSSNAPADWLHATLLLCRQPKSGLNHFKTWLPSYHWMLILLSSGVSITWSHHRLINNIFIDAVYSIMFTVLLGVYFLIIQYLEYTEASFTIADGIYGTTFYLCTGFHGFHVIVGTVYLFYVMIIIIRGIILYNHHFAFEAAAWYWHFVDVVWLFLFISIYWWGSI